MEYIEETFIDNFFEYKGREFGYNIEYLQDMKFDLLKTKPYY